MNLKDCRVGQLVRFTQKTTGGKINQGMLVKLPNRIGKITNIYSDGDVVLNNDFFFRPEDLILITDLINPNIDDVVVGDVLIDHAGKEHVVSGIKTINRVEFSDGTYENCDANFRNIDYLKDIGWKLKSRVIELTIDQIADILGVSPENIKIKK